MVENPNMGKLSSIVQEAIGFIWGHTFAWKAFWNVNSGKI
jgi:hypothetical protein